MTDRARQIDTFLTGAGWGDARRDPLPGDASLRRYIRLQRGADRAIMMDAPPETGEDVRPFLRIGDWLSNCGLAAPDVLARDATSGFLLLEDLGDDLVAHHSDANPDDAPMLYAAAADVLTELHRHSPPELPHYPDQMADLAATVVDWYAPDARAHRNAIRDAMQAAIDTTLTGARVLVHRDYHAENLLWLPDRAGVRRIGLLDFQDAMTGPGEYDLASLIHDPRRAVTNASAIAATQTYLAATDDDPDAVAARIAVCSVQRSLRIIGRVFARLCLHSGRASYLRFIPPTWVALQRELQHPALAELRSVLDGLLPEPDPAWIADKVARAGTLAGRTHAGSE